MQFNPKDAKKSGGSRVLPAGEYNAEVFKAEEAISKKSGNPMFVITLKVYSDKGNVFVRDYITNPRMLWKLKDLCASAGIDKTFDTGSIDTSDLAGKNVRVKLAIDEDTTGQYDDKNAVKSYVFSEKKAAEKKAESEPEDLSVPDDVVPF